MTKRIKYSDSAGARGAPVQQVSSLRLLPLRLRIGLRLSQLSRQEQGSFTLEASIVFPVLLAFILLFLIFGMYMYQKVVLFYAASSIAERTAFAWDNSYRDPRSGMLETEDYDGLYWRIGDDGMLGSVFGLEENGRTAYAELPPANEAARDKGELATYKLLRASKQAMHTEGIYSGQINYSRSRLLRTIEVKLKRPLAAGSPERSLLGREPVTLATATIVDPVEFIRSVDLARYYVSRFAGSGAGADSPGKAQAGQVLAPYKGAGR
jgi:hypothetical protein